MHIRMNFGIKIKKRKTFFSNMTKKGLGLSTFKTIAY